MRRSENRRMRVEDERGLWRLRLWRRARRKHKSARLLIKCGDCENKLEIYYDDQFLEIGGVFASIPEWRRVLQPLLDAEPEWIRRQARRKSRR